MKLKTILVLLGMWMLMPFAMAYGAKGVISHPVIQNHKAVMQQNSAVKPTYGESWLNRITLGGMGSIVGVVGNKDLPGSFSERSSGSNLFLNNANLLADVDLGQHAQFSLNLACLGAPSQWYMDDAKTLTPNVVSYRIFADEAYVTFANFTQVPLFFKVGRAYVPFGEYNEHYVPWQIESPAQMLAETNGPTAILGMSSNYGWYASVFALKGETTPLSSNTNNIRNWGGKLGYSNNLGYFHSPDTKVNVNVSYIRNVWDSRTFTPNINSPQEISSAYTRDPVGGLSAHLDLSYKAFSAYADWVTTLKNLRDTYSTSPLGSGNSKFWGANVNAAYAFATLAHDSSLGAGFQFSGNGEWFASSNSVKAKGYGASESGLFSLVMPKWRALVEYKVNLYKHADLGLVYAYSKSYDFGSKQRSTNVGLASVAVKF